MPTPLLTVPHVSTPGRGPGGTTRVFFWGRADRQHFSAPPALALTGSLVDIMYDQSYYDHHLDQTSGGNRPTRLVNSVTCGPDQLDSVDFDGTDDRLKSLAFQENFLNFDLVQEIALHVAFRANNNTDATLVSIHDEGIDRDGISISIIPGGVVGRLTLGLDCGDDNFVPTLFTIPGGLTYNDGQVHTISLLYNQVGTNNLRLFSDGVLVQMTLNTNGLYARSKIITVGQYDSDNYYFDGEILEVIGQRTATLSEQATIYDYFQRKWCAV